MDRFDLELKEILKNWAQKQVPPASGRNRLLSAAVQSSAGNRREKTNHFDVSSFPVDLYSWAMVYSMKRGVSALRVVS
jgi:hypothetical protein